MEDGESNSGNQKLATKSDSNSPDVPKIDTLDLGKLKINQCRYQLNDEIARGGMGSIVHGHDTVLNRDLAVKVLLEDCDDDESVQRFLREAQISGQLQHPGIVPVYELGTLDDDRPFFAMKLVKGKTLKELLKERNHRLDDRSKFLGVFEQVCQTMAYAHSRQVIHRDLKPSNIMVGAFGEVQVMDWGVAKVLTDVDEDVDTARRSKKDITTIRTLATTGSGSSHGSETRDGVVFGTLAYMSPEQALDEKDKICQRSDVFGLGAILCEILTGSPPYSGDTTKKLYRLAARGKMDDAWLQLDRCEAAPELIEIAKGCLNYEPEDRPAHAGIVAEKIASHFESVDLRLREAELERTKTAEAQKRRRVKQALMASLLLTMLLGACGWIWMQFKESELDRVKLTSAELELDRQLELSRIEQGAKEREYVLKEQTLEAKLQKELALSDAYTDRAMLAADQGDTGAAVVWFTSAAEEAKEDQQRRLHNTLRAANWLRQVPYPIACYDVGLTVSVDFQPGGQMILIQFLGKPNHLSDPIFMIIDSAATNGAFVPWFKPATQKIGKAAWSPDGNMLGLLERDGDVVEIWDARKGVLLKKFESTDAQSIAFSNDSKRLAIATDKLRIWQIEEEIFLPVSWPTESEAHSLGFNSDGSKVVAACMDNQARVFEVGNQEPYFTVPHFDQKYMGFSPCRSAPVWLPLADGKERLAANSSASHLEIWDVGQKELESENDTSLLDISNIAVHPDADSFSVAGYFGSEIRKIADASKVSKNVKHGNFTGAQAFSKDGKVLFTGSMDKTAQLWSFPDGEPMVNRSGTKRV